MDDAKLRRALWKRIKPLYEVLLNEGKTAYLEVDDFSFQVLSVRDLDAGVGFEVMITHKTDPECSFSSNLHKVLKEGERNLELLKKLDDKLGI